MKKLGQAFYNPAFFYVSTTFRPGPLSVIARTFSTFSLVTSFPGLLRILCRECHLFQWVSLFMRSKDYFYSHINQLSGQSCVTGPWMLPAMFFAKQNKVLLMNKNLTFNQGWGWGSNLNQINSRSYFQQPSGELLWRDPDLGPQGLQGVTNHL